MEISELKKKNQYFAKVIGKVSSAVPTKEILFRCSSLGKLMVEPRSKSELIPEGTKTYLVDVWVTNKYERYEEVTSKYLDKGNKVEEDSITIVSRITKEYYTKNEAHLRNTFIKGTPDLFKGPSIHQAERIRDTKSSFNIFTFHRSINKELSKDYYWQGQGYMWLTGATKCNIDYCLNNTPYHIIEGELRKESYNHLNQDTPTWIELQIIAKHTYDRAMFENYINQRGCYPSTEEDHAIVKGFVEVPLKERFFTFEFERSEEAIERLQQRITDCREWIKNNLDTKFNGAR